MMRRRKHSQGTALPQHAGTSAHFSEGSSNSHDSQHMPVSYQLWRILLFVLVSIALLVTIIIARQQDEPGYVYENTIIPKDHDARFILQKKYKSRDDRGEAADKRIADTTRTKQSGNVHREERKMRSIPGFFPIFDRCAYPQQEKPGSLCGYFRPVLFFQEGQPGHVYRDVVLKQKFPDIRLAAWSWQVNNWHINQKLNGPPMLLPDSALLHHVESVFGFATPKSGSRTQWQLFLDHLTPPKKPIQKRRVGEVTVAHLEQLHKRQEAFRQQYNGTTGMHKRRDVVYAVIRDPVSRFLSSMTQVLSMRHTARCNGCDENLEPCIKEKTSSREVLECVIKSVQQNGFWNEHIVPSAVFLTRPLAGVDVEMAVFPIEHLNDLVEGFGVGNEIQLNQRETKAVDQQVQSLAMLSNQIIADICSLYAMDVAIMRHLGFPVRHCDVIQIKMDLPS